MTYAEIVIAALVLGATLSFMVGPVFFVLIETSLLKGPLRAIVFDMGVIFADVVFIAIVYYMQINLFDAEEGVWDPKQNQWLFWVGGGLVVGYGVYSILNSRKKQRHLDKEIELPPSNAPWYLYVAKGFFLNFLNVGVLVWWAANMVWVSQATEYEFPKMLTYFIVTVVSYFAIDLIKIFSAHHLKKKLTDTFLVKIERTVGVILVGFGLVLGLRGYFGF